MLSESWCPPCGMHRRADQPCSPQHVERAQVLDQPVAQGAVELQPVAVGPQTAVAQQVAGVLHREQVLAGRERTGVGLRDLGVQGVVEGLARAPRTRTGRTPRAPRAYASAVVALEPAVGVDGQALPRLEHLEHRLDAPQVLLERRAGDLHLHDGVAARGCSRASPPAAPPGPCPGSSSRRRRRRTPGARRTVAVPVGQQREQRLRPRSSRRRPTPPCRRCRRRPSARRARRASRSSSSPARPGPGPACRASSSRLVRRRLEDARDDALAQQRALAVAAVGVEAVARRPAGRRARRRSPRRPG